MATIEPITSLDNALALSASRTFLVATECAQRFLKRVDKGPSLTALAKGSRVAITVTNAGDEASLRQVFDALVAEMGSPKVKPRIEAGKGRMYVNVRNFMYGFTPALYRQWPSSSAPQ